MSEESNSTSTIEVPPPVTKPKRVLSEAQRAAFMKAQAKRMENIRKHNEAKKEAHKAEMSIRKGKRAILKDMLDNEVQLGEHDHEHEPPPAKPDLDYATLSQYIVDELHARSSIELPPIEAPKQAKKSRRPSRELPTPPSSDEDKGEEPSKPAQTRRIPSPPPLVRHEPVYPTITFF
jgi:hypothetical protein